MKDIDGSNRFSGTDKDFATGLKVGDWMSAGVITVKASYSLEAAQNLMENHKIRHLPVVNDNSEVIGILSHRDLQRAIHSKILGGGDHKYESLNFDSGSRVKDYMSTPVKIIEKSVAVRLAAQKMVTDGISSLLVMSDHQVEGILTSRDCLRCLIELLPEV